jgi:cytochrome c
VRRAATILVLLALSACDRERLERDQTAAALTGGNPARGRQLARTHGCSACHTISGVPGADANVGPPLDRVGSRVYLGGVLVNTPDNMRRWLKDPPAVDPKTAMPNVGASDEDVRDLAAFLYTLR